MSESKNDLLFPNSFENYTFIPIVITIITSDGGSDKLLQAAQQGLSDLSIDIAVDLSFLVTKRHGMLYKFTVAIDSMTYIAILDGCQSEETVIPSISANSQLDVIINWPEVNLGQDAVVRCPCGGIDLGNGNLEARRYCGGTFSEGAQWEDGFVTPCNFSDTAREICNLANVRNHVVYIFCSDTIIIIVYFSHSATTL